MLLGPLRFHLLCYLCFGTITYVQEVEPTQRKKRTILPQLKLPSTTCLYKDKVYLYVLDFLKENQLEYGVGS